jgi:hypothetical protein
MYPPRRPFLLDQQISDQETAEHKEKIHPDLPVLKQEFHYRIARSCRPVLIEQQQIDMKKIDREKAEESQPVQIREKNPFSFGLCSLFPFNLYNLIHE